MRSTTDGYDPLELRRALGAFPTGVTVVTTVRPDGSFVGLTCNSFNSLSLDPPLILWSIVSSSSSVSAFNQASHFAINILSEDQAAVSRQFASKVPDKFAGLELQTGESGVPLIAGCSAYLECRTHSRLQLGDHVLIIGQVERFRHHDELPPLFFYGGKYLSAGASIDPDSK